MCCWYRFTISVSFIELALLYCVCPSKLYCSKACLAVGLFASLALVTAL